MGNPMTDRIAALIEKMLEENGGELEIQRNKLAGRVGLIAEREAHLMYAAVTDRTLENAAPDKRDALRADILRAFLLTLRTLRHN